MSARNYQKVSSEMAIEGFSIVPDVYTESEIANILEILGKAERKGDSFIQTEDLFAIRQLLNNIPNLKSLLVNQNIKALLEPLFEKDYFLTKAIYFDKPSTSNWFVGYHQDLSISVSNKVILDGYHNWTFKKSQYGVQPPVQILENIVTVRIHLDDTNENNGALKVIPKSHLTGIRRPNTIRLKKEKQHICTVDQGGVMLMKPLTMHASNRTTNLKRRRVVHLEFASLELKEPLEWLEFLAV